LTGSGGSQELLEELERIRRATARRADRAEAEVLRLLAAGHTSSEIVAEMVLSVHTVERHLQNAYRKIGHVTGPMPPPTWSAAEVTSLLRERLPDGSE
jgi:DNA-binding CsgD family transcriptional regulator